MTITVKIIPAKHQHVGIFIVSMLALLQITAGPKYSFTVLLARLEPEVGQYIPPPTPPPQRND